MCTDSSLFKVQSVIVDLSGVDGIMLCQVGRAVTVASADRSVSGSKLVSSDWTEQ